MDYFNSKIQNIRQKLAKIGLDDPRLLGVVLLAVIGLSVLWNGTRVVQQNYTLLKKIAILEEQNRIFAIENSNKNIQIEYFSTPEFAELKARRVNGKAAEGEKVYIVTENAIKNNLKTPTPTEEATEEKVKPKYQQNFEAWIDFFFKS